MDKEDFEVFKMKEDRKQIMLELIDEDLQELKADLGLTLNDMLQTRNAIYILETVKVSIEQAKENRHKVELELGFFIDGTKPSHNLKMFGLSYHNAYKNLLHNHHTTKYNHLPFFTPFALALLSESSYPSSIIPNI